MESIKIALDQIHVLSTKEFEQFIAACETKSYGKKEFLLEAGQTCREVHIVKEGLVGLYQLRDGREIYQDFYFEHDFATDVASLTTQEPSEKFLVTIEPTEVMYCSREKLLGLYQVAPGFQEFGRKLLERLLVGKSRHSYQNIALAAREKYEAILREKPHFVQRVPLQALATYLGMTRETLSRIRKDH